MYLYICWIPRVRAGARQLGELRATMPHGHPRLRDVLASNLRKWPRKLASEDIEDILLHMLAPSSNGAESLVGCTQRLAQLFTCRNSKFKIQN